MRFGNFVIDLSTNHVVRDEFLLAVAGQCAFRDAEDAAEVIVRVVLLCGSGDGFADQRVFLQVGQQGDDTVETRDDLDVPSAFRCVE